MTLPLLNGIKKSKTICRYLVQSLLVIAVIASFFMASAIPVSANPGLNVEGANILTNVTPGQTFTHTITLTIGASDAATDIGVTVMGVKQNEDGSLQLLDASRDTGNYSARSFVTVDKQTLHLAPGIPQDVIATIQVPQNVGDGGRYAAIYFATQATAGAGVNIVTAVYVPVYLTITGGQIIQTGKITGVTTNEVTSGQPINILTDFQSTGNHHFKIQGQVTVKDAEGQIMDTISTPLMAASILPGATEQLKATLAATGSLTAGTYSIDSKVMMEDETLLDEATSTFKITGQYVPPPSVGTIKLDPSSASTVKNADGTVSVTFPQGAAVVPVEVSIHNNPNQLAAFPTGYTAASTTFEVNGLTGLLAKDATITVKYSSDDLSKAGGNVSKLKLMLWIPATNQWVPLKTKVDSNAATLSATSNQMGIFAVAVASAASSGINWMIIGIIAVIVIIIAVVIFLLMSRRKPKQKPTKR